MKKVEKTIKHTKEFIEKQNARLQAKLIAQIKAEDPRYFINEYNVIHLERLPNETFKLIPGTTRYYVSDKGRAMKLVYDKFLDIYLEHELSLMKSPNKNKRIYNDINIRDEDGNAITCRLSRAIAKTFIDPNFPLLYNTEDKRVVDHNDNNSLNNELSNLVIKTQSQNILDAIYDHGRPVGRSVKECYAYNVKTKEVRHYPSTAELCRDIWRSSNKGYFNAAYNNRSTTKHGWRVGYDIDEIKSRGENA